MNLSFLIDKSQTFQMISEILIESNSRGYSSTVYSFCDKDILNFDNFSNCENIDFLKFSNLNSIIDHHSENRDKFDASNGINFFNERSSKYYTRESKTNFAVEYCWNEIYKSHKPFAKDATLFCNSVWSQEKISEISGHKNAICLGSPWFEFIKRFKSNQKQGYAVLMAPHDQYFLRHSNFSDMFLKIIKVIKECCNSLGIGLVLKSRRKFSQNYEKLGVFDGVSYDDSAFGHLTLYSNSEVIFNFCSSAINELAFVETPAVCIFPDLHAMLRDYEKDTFKAMKTINDKYYNDIFDNIHCCGIDSSLTKSTDIFEKIKSVIHAKKDWKEFQDLHFKGNHSGSSSRILDHIGKTI